VKARGRVEEGGERDLLVGVTDLLVVHSCEEEES
jgi:hypothetical protein